MLVIMASYFQTTWQHINDAQGDNLVHGHEAMRRILWHAIKSMEADILIDIEPLEVNMSSKASYYTMNTRQGTKRKAESEDVGGEGSLGTTMSRTGTSKKRRVESLESSPAPMTQFLTTIRDSHKNGKKWLQATEVGYAGLDLCSGTTTGNN